MIESASVAFLLVLNGLLVLDNLRLYRLRNGSWWQPSQHGGLGLDFVDHLVLKTYRLETAVAAQAAQIHMARRFRLSLNLSLWFRLQCSNLLFHRCHISIILFDHQPLFIFKPSNLDLSLPVLLFQLINYLISAISKVIYFLFDFDLAIGTNDIVFRLL